jgi:hypothetical protein
MRKLKITSNQTGSIFIVSSEKHISATLSHMARKAHPRSPITITVEDVTEDQTRLKVGKPDWAKGP